MILSENQREREREMEGRERKMEEKESGRKKEYATSCEKVVFTKLQRMKCKVRSLELSFFASNLFILWILCRGRTSCHQVSSIFHFSLLYLLLSQKSWLINNNISQLINNINKEGWEQRQGRQQPRRKRGNFISFNLHFPVFLLSTVISKDFSVRKLSSISV